MSAILMCVCVCVCVCVFSHNSSSKDLLIISLEAIIIGSPQDLLAHFCNYFLGNVSEFLGMYIVQYYQ